MGSCNSGFGMPDDVFGRSHGQQQQQHHQSSQSREQSDPYTTTGLVSESSNSNESIVSMFSQDRYEMGEIVDSLLVMTNLNGMRRGGPQFVHWECADWREKGGAS